MKTPKEIASYTFAKMHSQAAEECENEILAHIVSAIEADRAQWRFQSCELQATLDRFNEATTNAEINDSAREMYDIVNRLHTQAIDQDFQEEE